MQEQFTNITYHSASHYRILRWLNYIRQTPYIYDTRLDNPIAFLESRRSKDGTWITEKRIAGDTYFDMETWGKPSRWITLKGLRILQLRNS